MAARPDHDNQIMTERPEADVPTQKPKAGRYPELSGRTVVISGGARGIGRGIADRFVAEGANVVLCDIDADALDEAISALADIGGSVVGVAGDIGQRADVERLFHTTTDRFGAVDVLVNNAADLRRRSTLDDHEPVMDAQLSTNVIGPYICSQRAAALMADAGGGSIINLSSVGGSRAHHQGLPYDVTKGAIDAMTRAMAIDLGPRHIRVNAIAPGVTNTYRSRAVAPADGGRTMADLIPLRRVGTVSDIAAMAAFLASDESAYVTGQVLFVDGGITAQLSPPGPHAF